MITTGSITGTSNNNMQTGYSGINMQTDSFSKNIQNQIANAQKQLQEISSNEELSDEEKMKKRQDIQQEINTLNQQLRQHQIEQRRKQQTKGETMEDMIGGGQKAAKSGNQKGGLPQASMQAMISANSSMKMAKVQGSMASQLKGEARVLKSEIKTDSGRGRSTEKKEEELAVLEEKANNAAEAQISNLADAGKAVEEAAKAYGTAETAESKRGEKDKAEKMGKDKEVTKNIKGEGSAKDSVLKAEDNGVTETVQQAVQSEHYAVVDIRL